MLQKTLNRLLSTFSSNNAKTIEPVNVKHSNIQRANVYNALCKVLSDRSDQVAWESYSAADWDLFGRMAVAEGVGPLIHWKTKGANGEVGKGFHAHVPRATLDVLAQEYYKTAAHNALLLKELERILGALNEAGIPVIVLKGAALAQTIYPDPALRPMVDLDLLVKQEALSKAEKIVLSLKYNPARPELWRWVRDLVSYEVNFDGGEHIPIHLELHWSLIGGASSHHRPEIDWFWEQTEEYNASNKQTPSSAEILSLNPTARLLYLISHLTIKHSGDQARLLWCYDLALLIRRSMAKIDWGIAAARAREFDWNHAYHNCLSELSDLFAIPIPYCDDAYGLPNTKSTTLIFSPQNKNAESRWARTQKGMSTLDWKAKIRFALALAFPSPKYMRWRYDLRVDWALALYYFFRWFDILLDAWRTYRSKK